jgi:hypothetical protein
MFRCGPATVATLARPRQAKPVNRGRGVRVIAPISRTISIGTQAGAGTLWLSVSWMFDGGAGIGSGVNDHKKF